MGVEAMPTNDRPRWGRWILGLMVAVLVIAVIFHLLGSQRKVKHDPPATVVSASSAVLGDMPVVVDGLLGTVTPVSTVTVLPQISGYLTEVAYQEGQQVQKGQFLAQIDPRPYEISRRQALAQLQKDQAALASARADLARYRQLHGQHSIAEQTYVDQQFTVQQAEAAVNTDRQAVAQYELDLKYCRITAPVAGRVGLRLVDVGNYVTASSATGLVVITSEQPTTVEFGVPQNAMDEVLRQFKAGHPIKVSAWNSDNTRKLGEGVLASISNQMDTSTGTVMLRASFENADGQLFPQAFVNIVMQVDTLHQAVLVPTEALQNGAPGDFVYQLNPDHTVSVRKVQLGPGDGVHTVVSSGLKPGDIVVTDGLDRLSDGATVRVADPQQGPARAGSTATVPAACAVISDP